MTTGCIEPRCPLPATNRSRCAAHARIWEKNRRPSYAARGYGQAYREARAAILSRNPPCAIRLPGCTGRATTVDHIIPVSLGGSRDPSNLRAACSFCNSSNGGSLGGRRPRNRPRTIPGEPAQPAPRTYQSSHDSEDTIPLALALALLGITVGIGVLMVVDLRHHR